MVPVPFFRRRRQEPINHFFFSEAPHYVSMFRFMATLREIWILPINPKISRHNGVKLLSLCLSNYVYTMSDMKINAFEITDFFYRFSGNFIIQCFKAKRRIPINRWLKWYKYQPEKYTSHLYMSDVAYQLAKAQTGGITQVKARYTIDPVS